MKKLKASLKQQIEHDQGDGCRRVKPCPNGDWYDESILERNHTLMSSKSYEPSTIKGTYYARADRPNKVYPVRVIKPKKGQEYVIPGSLLTLSRAERRKYAIH